ncbi:MAG: hypothetical protein HGA37_02060 [Lentimicrobium sp.]|nr:hypothetical protein [Lentimicrobium sp.]
MITINLNINRGKELFFNPENTKAMELFKRYMNDKAAGSYTAFLFLIILAILAFLFF